MQFTSGLTQIRPNSFIFTVEVLRGQQVTWARLHNPDQSLSDEEGKSKRVSARSISIGLHSGLMMFLFKNSILVSWWILGAACALASLLTPFKAKYNGKFYHS